MYRPIMKRLLCSPSNLRRSLILSPITTTTTTTTAITSSSSSSSSSPSHFSRFFSIDSNTPHPFPHQNSSPQPPIPEAQVFSETLASSSSSTTAAAEEAVRHHENQRQRKGEPRRPRVEYQEEQARVLQAALRHVMRLGWSETAIVSGAKEVGVSPSILGSFPRKEAALVEFFMDDCLEKLIDIIESGEDLKNLIHSERIAKLIRIRLEMQAPYISKWAQALSIQAQPMNLPTSFKQRAVLIDEILHASGDQASDIDWYVKRTVLGGVYSAAEVYMLTDNSPDFRDTWKFIDNRVKDAFDLEKTVQEAKYLAEAVGAGIGSSLQGFMKGVSPGR